jgi:8-oxo-dGTP pyrophosphatase MutT (NUDIX family)
MMNENIRLANEVLDETSLIARQLIVAKYEDEVRFLCRSRSHQDSYFANALEIPGGTLDLTNEGIEYLLLLQRKYSGATRYISGSFESAMARELTEEFGYLTPVLEVRKGAFITHVTSPSRKRTFLEATDFVILDPYLLEKLHEIGNHYRNSESPEGEWQIKNISSVLQKGQPMLPTLYAVLSRFKGQYVYEHEGWQIYGEYIPYNQTFFATRGKEITLDSPPQG